MFLKKNQDHDVFRGSNNGWGYAVGEFALILIPSFIPAAAIEQQKIEGSQLLSVGVAPIMGAGMICPDTAYTALSPAQKNKLQTQHQRNYIKFSHRKNILQGFLQILPIGHTPGR